MTDMKFGLLYEPSNENEVRIPFGLVMPYLGEKLKDLGFGGSEYYLDDFTDGDPDCTFVVVGVKFYPTNQPKKRRCTASEKGLVEGSIQDLRNSKNQYHNR